MSVHVSRRQLSSLTWLTQEINTNSLTQLIWYKVQTVKRIFEGKCRLDLVVEAMMNLSTQAAWKTRGPAVEWLETIHTTMLETMSPAVGWLETVHTTVLWRQMRSVYRHDQPEDYFPGVVDQRFCFQVQRTVTGIPCNFLTDPLYSQGSCHQSSSVTGWCYHKIFFCRQEVAQCSFTLIRSEWLSRNVGFFWFFFFLDTWILEYLKYDDNG